MALSKGHKGQVRAGGGGGDGWRGGDGEVILENLVRWRINWPGWIVTWLHFRVAGCCGPSSCSQVV